MSCIAVRLLSLVLVLLAQSRGFADDAKGAEGRLEGALARARRPVEDPVCLGWQDGSWLVHRYEASKGNWSSWPSPPSALPKKAVHAVGAHAVAVLDPWQQYSGWLFDLHTRRWTPIPVSPIAGPTNNLDPITAAFLEGRLVVWGLTKGPPHGAVLDTETMHWKPIANAPINLRVRALARAAGDKLYVWNGFGPGSPLNNGKFGPQNDGAVYDVARDKWQRLPEPKAQIGLYGQAATLRGDRFIVFGGRAPGGQRPMGAVVRSGIIFNPADASWDLIPESPFDIAIMPACAAAGDELFIWSGKSAAAEVAGESKLCTEAAVYNFVTRKWERLPEAPLQPRSLSFAKGSGRTVTVWGGWDSSANPTKFHRDAATFDLEKRVWQRIPDLPGDVPYALHPGW